MSADARLLLLTSPPAQPAPKAAICTQGRLAAAGRSLVDQFGVRPDDTHYICMPMLHGNAVIADWAPALAAGAGVGAAAAVLGVGVPRGRAGLRATCFTYVGRAVQYLLATPARGDGARFAADGLRDGGRGRGRGGLRGTLE